MKQFDIEGLTPKQIKDKFDLPYLPDKVADITPPKGTKIRTGTTKAGNFGGKGGAPQLKFKEETIKLDYKVREDIFK